MSTPKDEEIKIRVPGALKRAVKAIADSRYTSESEIAREAMIEYITRRGGNALREDPVPYKTKVSSDSVDQAGAKIVSAAAAAVSGTAMLPPIATVPPKLYAPPRTKKKKPVLTPPT